MTEKDYKKATEIIHAMNVIARAFGDEDYYEHWISDGVADGTYVLEDVLLSYPNDMNFYADFQDLCDLFLRLCVRQCVNRGNIVRIDTKNVISL